MLLLGKSCMNNLRNNNAKSWSGTWMDQIKPLSECEVRRLIVGSAKKTCILDPMPTFLVTGCTQVLLRVHTKVVNLSLESGTFADNWKCALVNPLLKKPGLDLVFKNCKPISNLHLSCILETYRTRKLPKSLQFSHCFKEGTM